MINQFETSGTNMEKVFLVMMVQNVLIEWFSTETNLDENLKLAVKRYAAQIALIFRPCSPARHVRHARFHCARASNNLHPSCHVQSCFKKGFECRNKLPDRRCEKTEPFILIPKTCWLVLRGWWW
jgi:hypothetical protein